MSGRVGRPPGRFTQHRRLEQLTDLLTRHPKGLTLEELATHLNVTERSMRRYLNEVRHEFELESTPTRQGGPLRWKIPERELGKKVQLRRTQVYMLLAARRLFELMKGSTLYEEIDLAIGKLTALAQRPGRGPNAGIADARLEERFLYLPFAPKDYGSRTEELDDLFQAVSDLKVLTVNYKSMTRADEERIVIHPYALVLHRDSIYCVGYHVAREEIRTFVLDRMRDTECSATERFALPEDFKVDDYFQGEFGIWKSNERHKVVIEFAPEVAQYVRVRKVHASQKLAGIAGGGIRLTMTVGALQPVVTWVLEWGKHARVVEPPELIARVKDELTGALSLYR